MSASGLDRLRRHSWLVPLTIGLFVLAAPLLGVGPVLQRQIMLTCIYALIVSGLNLAWGYAGELAVGQVAMYAAGAYTTGILARDGFDMLLSLTASLAVVAVLGTITAIPGLRLSGWGLAMSSFFLVSLIPDIIRLLPEEASGGEYGMLGIPEPAIAGITLDDTGYYMLVVGSLLLWLALMRNFVVSRHGNALQVVRDSPALAQSLGYSIPRLKAMAYLLGALPAGVAGWLFVYLDRYVAPEYFSFEFAIMIVAGSVLGGIKTVYGAVIGVLVLRVGTDQVAAFEKYTFIAYGLFMVVGGVLFAGKRYAQLLRHVRRRVLPSPEITVSSANEILDDELRGPTLNMVAIEKAFGGVRALQGVDMVAEPGKITALIGANGSGKTTMLNVISGFYRPDAGSVELDGSRVPPGRPDASGRMGIARTFQTPIMPTSLTVGEVVASARYRRAYVGWFPAMLRLARYRRVSTADHQHARHWLKMVGIGQLASVEASELPLGSRRLVEIARALASEGGLILLDEPASGLEASEVERLSDILGRLRDAGATVVLVEHNFEMVCDVADRIYVLERGRLIAEGTPDQIQRDEAVARSYLGLADQDSETVEAAT